MVGKPEIAVPPARGFRMRRPRLLFQKIRSVLLLANAVVQSRGPLSVGSSAETATGSRVGWTGSLGGILTVAMSLS